MRQATRCAAFLKFLAMRWTGGEMYRVVPQRRTRSSSTGSAISPHGVFEFPSRSVPIPLTRFGCSPVRQKRLYHFRSSVVKYPPVFFIPNGHVSALEQPKRTHIRFGVACEWKFEGLLGRHESQPLHRIRRLWYNFGRCHG